MQNDQEEISDIDEPVREMPEQDDDSDRPVINVSSDTVRFKMNGAKVVMAPGDVRHIPKAYAIPRQLQPNAPALPSTVEHITGNKVYPIDHEKARAAVSKARAAGKL